MFGFSLLSAIPVIGKFFDFGTTIATKIADLKIAQANAQTEQERIRLAEQVRVLEIQQAQMAVEAQYNAKTNQLARFMFVIPVGLYIWAAVAWDKVICKFLDAATQASTVCTTDPIKDTTLGWVVVTVIGFYFLQNIVKGR